MTKFFFELTKRNWGWPYHVLEALILTQVIFFGFYVIFELWVGHFLFMWYTVVTWLLLNLVGTGYEIYQVRVKGERKGFWEDIIGNNLGFVLGILLIKFILWSLSCLNDISL